MVVCPKFGRRVFVRSYCGPENAAYVEVRGQSKKKKKSLKRSGRAISPAGRCNSLLCSCFLWRNVAVFPVVLSLSGQYGIPPCSFQRTGVPSQRAAATVVPSLPAVFHVPHSPYFSRVITYLPASLTGSSPERERRRQLIGVFRPRDVFQELAQDRVCV